MWFEPAECERARVAMNRGQYSGAAELLLKAPRRDHRACRQLLAELIEPLMDAARQALDAEQFDIARRNLELAQECGSQGPSLFELQAQLEARAQQASSVQQIAQRRAQRARQLAQEGRLQSALHWVDEGAVDSLVAERADWQQQATQLERYIAAARDHLDREQWAAASERLQHAALIARLDPRVIALQQEWQQKSPTSRKPVNVSYRPTNEAAEARHSNPRSIMQCQFPIPRQPNFALSDGFSRVLICRRSTVVIGGLDAPDADVSLRGRMRGPQVLLIRDGATFRASSAWSNSQVRINGQPLVIGAAIELHHGDLLDFSAGQVQFRFQQPHVDRGVAMLVANPTTSPRDLADATIDRILLTEASLTVGSTADAHWVVPDLPVDSLRLNLNGDHGEATADGAIVWWDGTASDDQLGQLHVEVDLPEAERFSRALRGIEMSDIVITLSEALGK